MIRRVVTDLPWPGIPKNERVRAALRADIPGDRGTSGICAQFDADRGRRHSRLPPEQAASGCAGPSASSSNVSPGAPAVGSSWSWSLAGDESEPPRRSGLFFLVRCAGRLADRGEAGFAEVGGGKYLDRDFAVLGGETGDAFGADDVPGLRDLGRFAPTPRSCRCCGAAQGAARRR